MDHVNQKLAGRYRLEEVIGRGGMGTVYKATDLTLRRPVAVKVLPAAMIDQDPNHVVRFEREARAAAGLNHPAIVAVYDAGADEDVRFIVMEYIEGRSLDVILREEGRLEPERAITVAARVADALAAAHAAGIVHRDVKPGNVMVTAGGEVKVLDFGIAHSVDAAAITRSTTVLGTAAYMAPEQALGRRTDARSDIYSLGCVLYAMLAGHPPFSGELPVAVLHQHANAAPPSLDENPAVSPALEALVMRMLAKSPDDRPQSAGEVRDELTAMAAGLGTAATAPLAVAVPTAATRPLAPASPRRPPRPPAPTRPLRSASPLPPPGTSRLLSGPAIAVALALLLAAIIVIALTSGGGGKSPAGAAEHRSSTTTTSSTPTTTSSTTSTPTTTSSSTTTSSTTSTPTTPTAPPPGPAGVPPGHAKKPKGPGKKGGKP